MKKKNTTTKLILIILGVIGFVLVGLWYTNIYRDEKTVPESEQNTRSDLSISVSPTQTPVPTQIKTIFVHVCGFVEHPGVVEIEPGSRVYNAIDAAGGFLEEADDCYLNLAKVVYDGDRIYVPSIFETDSLSVSERIEGGNQEADSTSGNQNRLININKADVKELTTLPGIGESRAKDIVSYRTRVGPFERIEDIQKVSGIGEAMFNRLKEYITVE